MKCEKKDCNEPISCLHYCKKHHLEICVGVDHAKGSDKTAVANISVDEAGKIKIETLLEKRYPF